MKTSITVRLAAACAAVFISFVLLAGVAALARPRNALAADTLAVAVAEVQAPDLRSGTP